MNGLITLERDPARPSKERLVGINGQTTIDARVIASVRADRRLFPHVVGHMAENIIRLGDPGFSHNPDEPARGPMLEVMGSLRNELKSRIDAPPSPEEQSVRLIALGLLASGSEIDNKAPYFAR